MIVNNNSPQKLNFTAIPMFKNMNKKVIRVLAEKSGCTTQHINDSQKTIRKFLCEKEQP